MTKKIYYPLALALTFSLFGCNEAPLEIEKVTPDNSEIHSSMMDEVNHVVPSIDQFVSQIELQEDIKDEVDVYEFDEWYPLSNDLFAPEGSDWGEIYAKVTDVRAYRTFTEAGLSPENCWEVFYEAQTNRLVNSPTKPEVMLIVAVDFTVENINATAEDYYNPYYDEGYDEYDFRIESLGGCCHSSTYWTGADGSLRDTECKDHPYVFHLEPGETISFTVYYRVDPFYFSKDEWYGWITMSSPPTMGINLHLKDIIPEEWFEEALALNEQFSKSDDIEIIDVIYD